MSVKGGRTGNEYLSVLGLDATDDITIGTTPLVMGGSSTSASWETTLKSGADFSVNSSSGLLTIPAGTYIINIFFTFRVASAEERFVQLTFWDDTTELLESLTAMPYLDSSSSYGNASISTIMTLSGSDKYQIKLDSGSSGTAVVWLSGGSPPNCGASFFKI